jgi:hypothetical protein
MRFTHLTKAFERVLETVGIKPTISIQASLRNTWNKGNIVEV